MSGYGNERATKTSERVLFHVALSPFLALTELSGSRLYAFELGSRDNNYFRCVHFCFFFFFSAIVCRQFSAPKSSVKCRFFLFFTSVNFYLNLAAFTLINFTQNFRAKNSSAQSRRIKVPQYYTKDANSP